MYNSNTSYKNRVYNKKTLYQNPIYTPITRPTLLPPLRTKYNEFKTVYSPNKYTRPGKICNTLYGTFNKTPPLPPSNKLPKYSLAKYPYLNPMFEIDNIVKNKYSDEENTDSDTIMDELDYHYNQRDWIKNESNKIVNNNKISLLKGDVVNIDKKTLIYVNYNSKSKLHVFKELTSLKVHEYNLDKRNYTIVIPKILKYDIITPKNSKKKIEYRDPFENLLPKLKNLPIKEEEELSEGYLSDLEQGYDHKIKVDLPNDIITNYVSDKVESIYNIDKSIFDPKIIIHQDEIEKTAKLLVDDIIESVVTSNKDILNKKEQNPTKESAEESSKESTEESSKDDNTNSSWCNIM